MKKKVLFFIGGIALVMLMTINVNFGTRAEGDSFTLSSIVQIATADGEGDPFCYAGGPGAASCSIEAGIEVLGNQISGGCSVSCWPGYYACCSLRCTCISG